MKPSRFLYHCKCDTLSVPWMYYTCTLHVSYKRYLSNSNIYVTTKFDENISFDSLAMFEDAMNYRLINQYCLNFVHISYYGGITHCKKLNSVGQFEIYQAGYLLTHPRI